MANQTLRVQARRMYVCTDTVNANTFVLFWEGCQHTNAMQQMQDTTSSNQQPASIVHCASCGDTEDAVAARLSGCCCRIGGAPRPVYRRSPRRRVIVCFPDRSHPDTSSGTQQADLHAVVMKQATRAVGRFSLSLAQDVEMLIVHILNLVSRLSRRSPLRDRVRISFQPRPNHS